MRNLRMSWYTAGDKLMCRWVESEEQETCHGVSTPLGEADDSRKESSLGAEIEAPRFAVARAA
jgi:hypothetical protein